MNPSVSPIPRGKNLRRLQKLCYYSEETNTEEGEDSEQDRVLNIQDDVSAFDQGFSLLWSCTVLYSEG